MVWSADKAGALFYGLPIADTASNEEAWVLNNPQRGSLNNFSPDIMILSKPDLYDHHHTLREFVAERGYERSADLRAFSIWQKPLH